MKKLLTVLLLMTLSPLDAGVRFGTMGAVKETVDELDKKVKARVAATTTSSSGVPSNLALPLRLNDVSPSSINPFGVVRWSLDVGSVGHGGIDMPISNGDPLYAVAAGTILSADPVTDGRGGSNLHLLIQAGTSDGEGWAFLYEHVDLAPGVSVGDTVTQGQHIADSAVTSGNNHLQLHYAFNNYAFYQDQTCWVDQLTASANTAFMDRFNNTWRLDAGFISLWNTDQREGRFPFRALLDTSLYPDGARPCYPKGTDVRQ